MFLKVVILAYAVTVGVEGRQCDQTPPQASVRSPSDNSKGVFQLIRETKESRNLYLPDQTYVLILKTNNDTRPFRWFMITAEDPEAENTTDGYPGNVKDADVGSLKTLDTDKSTRYSERCFSSVENSDNSNKYKVEVHWVSPKQNNINNRIRIRAMVAENEEVWYSGDQYLSIELEKNDNKPLDSPPLTPNKTCNLCSEARYEVIFEGKWSRLTHPRHYPTKPDENGYSYLIGASHDYGYTMWKQGLPATKGLQALAETGDIKVIQRELIEKISAEGGTRTLIRGRRRHHPYMHEPSHSLFRADRIHHLFSVAIAMRPSPDWFLGTPQFELCSENGWLESHEIPLYPWDAGTVDGISYESEKVMSNPQVSIERVAVGSFDRRSPFYQMNLNDLKPFAKLKVNLLDVYPLVGVDCGNTVNTATKGASDIALEDDSNNQNMDADARVEPLQSRSQTPENPCDSGDWTAWLQCKPHDGICGPGSQMRMRTSAGDDTNVYHAEEQNVALTPKADSLESCPSEEDTILTRDCYVECI